MTLLVPGLMSDIASVAFDGILAELADADWLDHVIVGVDGADASQYRRVGRMLDRLPQRHDVVWTDGPALIRLEERLRAVGLAPMQRGKGRNAWYCIGAALACRRARVIVMHDADIADYRKTLLARLAFPVAHPRFGYGFVKGYYPRITGGRFCGRATRLLVAPLVSALQDLTGGHPYLRYLEAFRYPLAGESAMTADVAMGLRMPGHWGMDIGILTDVYDRCEPSTICQADVAGAYDHKHQELSADDPSCGLRRMSLDVAAVVIWRLGVDESGHRTDGGDGGSGRGVEGVNRLVLNGGASSCIREAYLAAAKASVRHYRNDAEFNGYRLDAAAEEAMIEVFARSIVEAVELCRPGSPQRCGDPQADVRMPSWSQVFGVVPEAEDMLLSVLDRRGSGGATTSTAPPSLKRPRGGVGAGTQRT